MPSSLPFLLSPLFSIKPVSAHFSLTSALYSDKTALPKVNSMFSPDSQHAVSPGALNTVGHPDPLLSFLLGSIHQLLLGSRLPL